MITPGITLVHHCPRTDDCEVFVLKELVNLDCGEGDEPNTRLTLPESVWECEGECGMTLLQWGTNEYND